MSDNASHEVSRLRRDLRESEFCPSRESQPLGLTMHVKSQDLEKTSADVDNVRDTMSEEDPWPEAYDFKARIPGLTV